MIFFHLSLVFTCLDLVNGNNRVLTFFTTVLDDLLYPEKSNLQE